MKKIVLMLVAAVLLMNLCACGREETAPTAVDEQINVTPKVEATTAMEETIPFEPPVTEEPAEVEAERVMQEKKALAESHAAFFGHLLQHRFRIGMSIVVETPTALRVPGEYAIVGAALVALVERAAGNMMTGYV